MPRSKTIQYRFNKGELDPKLEGRADIESYYSSAEQLQNVVVLPQGAARRRPGLLYVDTVRNTITQYSNGSITASDPQTNGGTPGNLLDVDYSTAMLNTTGISTTDDYVSWQLDLGSLQDVAFIDLFVVTLSTGSTTEFEIEKSDNGSTWTSLSSPLETQHTITLDTTARFYRLAVDDNIRYLRFIRNGTTDLGSAVVSTGEVQVWLDSATGPAQTRLTRFEFNDDQSYVFLFSDKNLAVYKDGSLQANVHSPYTEAQLSLINYAQDHDTAIYVHEDIVPYELQRQGGHNLWRFTSLEDSNVTPEVFSNIPLYNYNVSLSNPTFVLTLDAVEGTVKVTDAGGGGNFSSAWVGNYIEGNGGRARVVKFIDTNNVLAQTELNFYQSGTSVVASGSWTRETGWSNIWNSTNGYPRAVTFYKGRLLFGGIKGAPETIVASVVGDFYNFSEGTLGDANGFYFSIDADKANVIYHFLSHDNLEIFCSESEWIVKSSDDFTPTGKTKFSKQSTQGIKPEIRPEEIEDGGTIYVQRGGQNLKEFVFSDELLSYKNDTVSVFSSHLVNVPVDGSIRHNTSTDESSLYMLINSDGNLVIVTLLKTQNITGFTENSTDGNFKNVIGLSDDIYCIVERTINGVTKRYFEELTYDRFTDSAVYMTLGDSRLDTKNYATASITPSAPNGGTAANVNDGDTTTYLTTTTNISTTDDYVAFSFDLGSNQNVDYIWLRNVSLTSGSTTEFQVEYSTDNFSSDINAASKTLSLSTTETSYEVPIGSSTRYIRLIRNGTTDLSTAKISIAEATVYLTKDATVSGLDYLEGKSVWTIIDGGVYGPETVSSGQITLDKNVFTDIEIGLDFDVEVTTNPIESPEAVGPLMGNRKSISEIIVNVYDTQHILVNSYSPFKQTLSSSSSSSTIDNTPKSNTARFRMVGFRGWDELGKITITQNYPLKMTLLNLGIVFNFGK